MFSGKIVVTVLVTLVVGFGAGFVLRPVLSPTAPAPAAATASLPAPSPADARGTQYFEAHLDKAQKIMADCREGTVRGDECFNAERAVVTAQAHENNRRFLGH